MYRVETVGAESFVGVAAERAAASPHGWAYSFLRDGEVEDERLTYGELDRRARAIAVALLERAAPGDRVVLLLQPGLDFVAGFFGCLYAGLVAVPVFPPRRGRDAARFAAILADASPAAVLADQALLRRSERLVAVSPQLGAARSLAVEDVDPAGADEWRDPGAGPETLAFLQYTSGSTSSPKGVMVTHGSLLANEEMIRRACGHDERSTFVSWLPVYHDMGLIGCVLQPLYLGAPSVLMSPVAFLQKPMRWLRAVSQYAAHTSGGPDFSYALCVEKSTPEERAELDLSRWRVAFDGAEPVRSETLERFATAFEPAGFRREAFFPCYGLAEATLIVSGGPRGETLRVRSVRGRDLDGGRVVDALPGGPDVRHLVGCGRPIGEGRVAIVDRESGRACPAGRVGEIWVGGPHVAAGYWQRPEVSRDVFAARLSDTGDGPFLRTGDLGFLRDGELYVTGRLKDLIIIRGTNRYPEDLERTAEWAHPALRRGGGAAFSIEVDGEERLALVHEVDVRQAASWDEVLDALVSIIAAQHELQPWWVALIPPGRLPKTSSGKVQRFQCRELLRAGELPVLAERRADAPSAAGPAAAGAAAAPEDWLIEQLSARLGTPAARLGRDVPLARFGLDSLAAIELGHELERRGAGAATLDELLSATIDDLARRLDAAAAGASRPAPARADEAAPAVFPLSAGQLALWLLQCREPDSAAHHIVQAVRVRPALDPRSLERVLERLVERHPALRTRFDEDAGEPFQEVLPPSAVDYRHRDARGITEAELAGQLAAEAHQPFDLAGGLPLRVRTWATADGDTVLLLVVHHLVADFWSLALLLDELHAAYAAETGGAAVALPAAGESYARHVAEEAARRASGEEERLWERWRERLEPLPAPLELAAERRPQTVADRGATFFFALDERLSRALAAAGEGRGASRFMTLLAGFHLLLHRYTGRRRFATASPSAGRGSTRSARTVGYYVNPLVLAADLSGDPSFGDLVERTRETAMDAFRHADLPFPRLVERLRPERAGGRNPLVDVAFALQAAPAAAAASLAGIAIGHPAASLEVGRLSLAALPVQPRPIQFDLTLLMAEHEGRLLGAFDYDPALFDAAAVSRMAEHLRVLLTAAVERPELAVRALPLLTAAERRQVVEEAAGAAVPRAERSVPARVEQRAAAGADAVALIAGDRHWSYGELDRRASGLARRLRRLGVGPEVRVGIHLPRSPEGVMAALAVWKAGGAYLPLDPSYPPARLALLLADGGARVVITDRAGGERLDRHGDAAARRVLIDAEEPEADGPPPPPCAPPPASLAYVVYTSGSTGRPKGVAVSHGALANLVDWHLAAFAVTAGDRASQLAAPGFDAAVWEVWPYLAAGAAVDFVPDAVRSDPPALRDWLVARRTTLAFLPTPLAEAVLPLDWPRDAALRTLLTGGDRLRTAPPAGLPFTLFNDYGPTENAVVATAGMVEPAAAGGALPPIGRPIANVRAFLLDRFLEPVPAGRPGELCLGGDSLARGYLDRPAATARAFVPDPFSPRPGGRLYRTGDLCRRRADGQIDFLGRLDEQVQVRGQRVEPGEVEAALGAHPRVAEAVVALAGGALVAWVVPRRAGELDGEELRRHVAASLPPVMVPAAVVLVDEIPRTPHGKLDRRALPDPAPRRGALRPRDALEETIAAVWAEEIGVAEVGVEDDLFALGGHSLLVARLAARLSQACGVDLSIGALFAAPTVAGVAAEVRRLRSPAAAAEPPLPAAPLVAVERTAPLPLSAGQRRLWFLDRLETGRAAYNVPAAAAVEGELDVAALGRALSRIVARHEVLRTTYVGGGEEPEQRIAPPAPVSMPVVDLAGLPVARREMARLARAEALRPFDLAAAPPLRSVVVRTSRTSALLLLTLHHIAADGWSVGLLFRELGALYAAETGGAAAELPPLRVQYADFAAWERAQAASPWREEQLAYWRRQLAALPDLELPGDRPRPAVASLRGGLLRLQLPADAAVALEALARREGATPFMALFAAYAILCARYARATDLAVGAPSAGRPLPELRDLIGFFVNTLVLRVDLGGDPGFRAALGRVRAVALAAYAHEELPFERLVEELQPARRLDRNPLFQTMFAAEPEMPPLRLGALPLRRVDLGRCTSRFDMSWSWELASGGPWVARIEYARDLFDRATVGRMARHLGNLVAAAVDAPDVPLSALPLLSAAEERQLLAEAAGPVQAPAEPAGVAERVARRAAERPQAVAVAGAGASCTYGELVARADRLAAWLQGVGVGPEVVVGVLLEPGSDRLVASLAALRAGGAYLPLEPSLPPSRLELLLADAAAAVVVSDAATAARLLGGYGGRVLRLDADRRRLAAAPASPAPAGVAAASLAYVVYTSGSTGRPKGVAVSHAALANLVDWHLAAFGVTGADRASLLASWGFDAAVWEVWPNLVAGAELCIPPEAARTSPVALRDWLCAAEVTVAFVPTPLAEAALVLDWPADAPLRLLLTGGDRLRLAPTGAHPFRVVNNYGPTEAAVVATSGVVPAAVRPAVATPPPIGAAIANTAAAVLDRHLRPVPAGVDGELCLAGAGLARGYLGRPRETADRFRPDPHGGAGGRLYRTGDLCRRRADGRLDFRGRLDDQVQVRGVRIEPGEIEAALAALPEVAAAVVATRDDASRLVAWVVPRAAEPEAGELRSALSRVLPAALVPTDFVFLAELPRTSRGKIDRRALPAPPAPKAGAARPRTPTEELLAGVWGSLLDLPEVGVEDDFFALGGHSLLAARLTARLGDLFRVELPVRAVFEAPTIAALARRVDAERSGGAAAALPPVTALPRRGDEPLSFGQQRLWFLDRLEPGSPFYNLPAALRLRGRLRPDALAAALAAVVARHEALRTVFAESDGRPRQVVLPPPPAALSRIDLAGLPEERRARELARIARRESARGFDLARGPLLRTALVRQGAEDHTLLVNLHHVVGDGWSIGILSRELAALYRAALAGRAAALPPLPVQYADFAAWQRRHLAGARMAAGVAWWRERLAGAPVVELPGDRPRTASRGLRGATAAVSLPPALSAAVRELASRQGVTPFMVLLAAFQALIGRWTGSRDVVVGTPVAGRPRPEVEGLIGFFVNTLALRGDLAGRPDFRSLLARTRELCLASFARQEVPFERLVEELRPERSLSHAPLVQVMLAVETDPPRLDLPDLECERRDLAGGTSRFDLSLALRLSGERIEGTLELARDLFDAATARRFLHGFERLLAAATAQPDVAVERLPLLSDGERHQVRLEWNDTESAGPPRLLHALVAARAAAQPEAVAIVSAAGETTYGELAARAAALAGRLRAAGVGADDRVAVLLDPGPELVVAALGALAAGGAYLPLDPSLPAARLAAMVADAAPVVLVTDRAPELLAFAGGLPVVGDVSADDAEPPAAGPALAESALAYVLFTSGSTGRPKAVAVPHGALVRRLLWSQSAHPLAPEDAVAQIAGIGFDFSIWEMFAPLLAGARIAFPPPGAAADPVGLVRWLDESATTVAHFVPSLLAAVLDAGLATCRRLRRVFSGGEALPWPVAARLAEPAAGRIELWNQYGPTEATIDATARPATAGPRTTATVPIGRPIAGMAARVWDRELALQAPGLPGELFLSGPGLARGYLGRPGLTAERFLPDPHGGEPGGRAYRTGDVARWLPDGEIEFLGRADRQVKLRGFRIELGEVEAALSACAGVREAAVLLRDELPGGGLVGYAAVEAAGRDEAASLRAELGRMLPQHMVPSIVVLLDALPRTASGKIDRGALPAPETPAGASRAPRGEVESALAAIWQEVLGVETVGIDDGFFDLGGHSLLVTQMVARVRRVLGVELPVRAVFEEPTIASLARRVAGLRSAAAGLPPLVAVPRGDDLPLSFAQARLWFLDRLAPSAVYNLPVGVRLRGELAPGLLAACLDAVVRRHEALRTTFPLLAGRPVQRIAAPAPVPLRIVEVGALEAGRRERELARLAAAAARRPFDLAQGPLLAVTLFRLGAGEHVLLVCLHHIVGDAWSTRVMLGEIARLYAAGSERRPALLPPLRVQYADFAAWQRSWLAGPALAAQVDYWRERLTGAPVLQLPTDRPRREREEHAGGLVLGRLPADLVRAVGEVARSADATPFMVLVAVFQALLARLADQREVVLGAPVAGRSAVETEPLVGFFVNTLALRVDHAGRPTFRQLLARVREACLGAYAHQDVPFERLVEELRPPRSLGQTPLFQTMLAMETAVGEVPAIPGFDLERFDVPTGTAKFDLTLFALEAGGGGLETALEYRSSLFDQVTARRLLARLTTLLAAAVARPDDVVEELPLIGEAERRQLAAWGGPPPLPAPGPGATLHGLVAAAAAARPAAEALRCDGESWSYGRLAGSAHALAHHLRRLGVGPEVPVAVCLERSPRLVVALLAVLEAGGAYVALDPAYPAERNAFVLADSRAPVVIGERRHAGALAGGAARAVLIDEEGPWREEAEEPPRVAVDAENLAYVLYTSGSTGRPKGVAIRHRSAVELVRWSQTAFADEELAGVVAATSICFDLSVFELFVPLARGGRVLLVRDALSLRAGGAVEGATLLNTVPSAAAELVRAAALPPTLRTVNLAGEPLPRSLVDGLHAGAGERRVLNLYGPSEDTTYSTWAEVPAGEQRPPSIGRPLPGTRASVLDRRGRPQPAGVPGELFLAGDGLARGYLGRPALTAERFVPDPSGPPGERAYRTGDLVRHRSDGELEFLGRLDHQVKVRGFRIEPGEIEAVLREHPGVADVAVAVVAADGGDRRLLAYCVVADGDGADLPALRAHARRRLPAYMVPAGFVPLAELPRLPNGKVDRSALPAGEAPMPPAAAFVAPRNELEVRLAALWAEALGVDRVGAEDDFFELGGHSLLAVQLLFRIEEELGASVPLQELFARPRVSALAEAVEARRGASPGGEAPAIGRISRDRYRVRVAADEPAPEVEP